MENLQFKLSTGEMDKILVIKELTIYHRLFVDDIGNFIPSDKRNFTELQEVLRLYELAFGTNLNLAKLVIIPLALPMIPQWLHDIGCTISNSSEVQKYLVAPFKQQLKKIDMYNFYLGKINKKIMGWANELLTFTDKVLLIQHVLQSITTYHMMYIAALVTTLK